MNEIKAIFTDLDGTVFRNDKTISERTMSALFNYRKKGGKWIVASARPERAITMYEELQKADSLITLNGARIRLGDKVISNGFSGEDAKTILSSLLKFGDLMIVLETSGGIFGNIDIPEWNTPKTDDLIALLDRCDVYKILLAGRDHELHSITDPTDHLCDSSEIAGRIDDVICKNMLTDAAYYTVAEGWLYQIMSRNATKWNGVKLVLETCGLDASEAIYLGDDNDDIESIRNIGRGIAMGNAIDKVKEVADCITSSNEEDGVAEVVESCL